MNIKFQKLEDTRTNLKYDWMICIDNVETLNWFHESWLKSELPSAWENIIKVSKGQAHINRGMSNLIWLKLQNAVDNNKPLSLIDASCQFENRLYTDKLTAILKYGKIFINKNGGYFSDHKDLVITETLEKTIEEIIFPQYEEKDIRITKWEGGTHFYAHVGMFEVFEHDGTNKWNTHEEAMKKAKSFLWNVNRKAFAIKDDKIIPEY